MPWVTRGSTFIMSEGHKEAIRMSRKGYIPTPETRERISEALMGHEVSRMAREHISRGKLRYANLHSSSN